MDTQAKIEAGLKAFKEGIEYIETQIAGVKIGLPGIFYKQFIHKFLFTIVFGIPIYIIETLICMFKAIYYAAESNHKISILKIIFQFSIDLLRPISIILLFVQLFYEGSSFPIKPWLILTFVIFI